MGFDEWTPTATNRDLVAWDRYGSPAPRLLVVGFPLSAAGSVFG
jgi:hypothetical protein